MRRTRSAKPPLGSEAASAESHGPQRQISLLFDVFVLNQRLRSLLARALSGSGMRPDDYAVYSLLFEVGRLTPTEMAAQMGMPLTTVLDYVRAMAARGHVSRSQHPSDGRSYRCSLTEDGLGAFWVANAAWNEGLKQLEPSLAMPVVDVRRAIQALDDAAAAALDQLLGESISEAG